MTRAPPLATVWTVRLMLGAFVALAGFFTFMASFVIELFLVSLIARPDRLPPIAIVPLFAISAVVTAISVGAVVRRLRRMLGLGSWSGGEWPHGKAPDWASRAGTVDRGHGRLREVLGVPEEAIPAAWPLATYGRLSVRRTQPVASEERWRAGHIHLATVGAC
jgi:hypothetical protein